MSGTNMSHMSARGLSAGYHGFQVIQGMSLEVQPGVTVVLGPNGAGKTTLLKALAGLLPRTGEVLLDGVALPSADAAACVKRGLALVAEGRQLFAQMTVTENLELGGWLIPARLRAERLARAFDDFPRLKERATQLAGTMSGGEQQMLALGRALMSAPSILIVDEPSVGLAPLFVSRTIDMIAQLKERYHLTVLMAEQNFTQAMRIADKGYVIVHGEIAFRGESPEEMQQSDLIRQHYLGM